MSELMASVGSEVSFIVGDGWETTGCVGRVTATCSDGGVVVRYRAHELLDEETLHLPPGTFALGAIRYCDAGRESALDYASRVAQAVRCRATPNRSKEP